jgi:uncharacterized protein GlcG (DUF336 family)
MKHALLVLALTPLTLALDTGSGPALIGNGKELTLAGARQVIAAGAAEAKKLNAGGAFAVVDAGGHLLCLERLDGTFPAASTVAIEKARTAAIFRRETRAFEEAIRGGRTSLTAVPAITPLEGGVPIVVEGVVIGAIGVSGAQSSQQDEELAKLAAASLN